MTEARIDRELPKAGGLLPPLIWTAAAMSLALAACVAPRGTGLASGCKPGEQAAVQDTLYFGTGSARGPVTEQDWSTFLQNTVTPRFPRGLTVSKAVGQWRGADGVIVRESTFVLVLIHPDDAPSETAVAAIVASYKAQFQQESVLRSRAGTCASF